MQAHRNSPPLQDLYFQASLRIHITKKDTEKPWGWLRRICWWKWMACLFLPKCNKHHDQNVRTPTQSFRLLFSATQKSKLSPVKRAFLPDAVRDGASMPKSIKILIWMSWAQWAVWPNSAVLIIFIVLFLHLVLSVVMCKKPASFLLNTELIQLCSQQG